MGTILIVDDEPGLRDGLAEAIGDLGHRPHAAATGSEALAYLASHGVDAVLLDLRMPGGLDGIEVLRRIRSSTHPPPVTVLTAFASADNTIEAMRLGAFDHLTKPIGRDELKSLLDRMLPGPEAMAGGDTAPEPAAGGLIGMSDGMRRVQKTIGLAADSDATVLVLGETGTGKELVARALHEHGGRKAKPFIAVNCAAIPSELLESELFGHVKGAFTGASTDRAGAFRDASGGTLFLDEIGDMSLPMQAKILRVLQERVLTPVGGKPVAVDVRVIAATHRDLANLVSSGAFREDLFYRLNVVPIALPPVRERLADIVPLAEHFLRLSSRDVKPKRLTARAAARLLAYGWPGNVREIKNVVERANVLVRGDVVDADDLKLRLHGHADPQTVPAEWLDGDLPTALADLEKAMIVHALAACSGNRAEAARRLKINRQLLYAKMRQRGLAEKSPSDNPTPPVRESDTETSTEREFLIDCVCPPAGTVVAVHGVKGATLSNEGEGSMMSKRHRTLAAVLLMTTILSAGAAVYAQPRDPLWDSSQLPETKGTIKQYTLTPRGDIDGLILTDGTEVKLPPHLSAQVVYAVRPGDAVSVRGLKARALALVDATSITNFVTGVTVIDNGPPNGPGRAAAETTLTGKVVAALHGKRGEVNGAVLENGTILRLPPPEAERMQSLLAQGQTVAARGAGLVTPLGTVVEVSAIGSSTEQLMEVAPPPPRRGGPRPKGPGRDPGEFGPPAPGPRG